MDDDLPVMLHLTRERWRLLIIFEVVWGIS